MMRVCTNILKGGGKERVHIFQCFKLESLWLCLCSSHAHIIEYKIPPFLTRGGTCRTCEKARLCSFVVPSFYMNVGHFSEYSGHPNNKFQTFFKNSRVQVGVYLWCTKICIFQSRFCTIFFKIFCSVFPEKFMKNHFHFANLFTGLGFSTCTFLWNRAS